MSHVRSVSGVNRFHVGATNAVLRPGELVTIRGDGAHPRCKGPSDGVVVKCREDGVNEQYHAGASILIALLASDGDQVITVNDEREEAK